MNGVHLASLLNERALFKGDIDERALFGEDIEDLR
jgi:hypothetical protein